MVVRVHGRHVLAVASVLGAGLVMVAAAPTAAQAPTCFGEAATILAVPEQSTAGTDGDDVIVGTAGADDIAGGLGDDLICGLDGDDVIRGNGGADRIRGGAGADRLSGGAGSDLLSGGSGSDLIIGGKGADELVGNGGRDTLRGKSGNDIVRGGRGRDTVQGGTGDDAVSGGRDNDVLAGQAGADSLDGGRGVDRLDGGRGPDTCVGGQGATDDTSCLEGLSLTLIADLRERAGLVTSPPDDDRLFVVEQYHGIRIIKDGALLDTPFLDLEGDVSVGNEQGVLGLAFHPDYGDNGRFFVDYTKRNGDTRVVEYQVRQGNPDRARKRSARVVIEIEQPHRWHNGGMLAFGPDGYLYIGTGDGGPGDDPDGQGQNKNTLLSALLRIDVDGDAPYEIPDDNPFVDTEGADELWAYGLRNPWRFSFDAETERVYIGDVGQYIVDEIDIAPMAEGGINYGWSTIEANTCFRPRVGCDRAASRPPTVALPHSGGACSVIGGYVYRGDAIPELDGHYFWSDFCNRELNTLRFARNTVTERTSWLTVPNGASGAQGIHDAGLGGSGFVTSLGQDASGELYIATLGGRIYRIDPER